MLNRQTYFVALLLLILFSCGHQQENKQLSKPPSSEIKYAERFSIRDENGYKKVYLFGNRYSNDTTATFIIYSDSAPQIAKPDEIVIKAPCKKIAALSSIYARIFFELNALDNVIAIDNIDYVNCEGIIERFNNGRIIEIAKGVDLNLEQTIALKPDIIFSFGMGDWEKDRNKKVESANIPIAISLDHMEQSPLARAEWIKFFAVFVDKSNQADSIFNLVEKNYYDLKEFASKVKTRPSVFNEIKYSDSWYMPGGKSYVAQLLEDAGANYLWKDNEEVGSLALSFEQVYARAKEADYWINLSMVKSKAELEALEDRYAEFKAFKNGNLYNNNKVSNAKGYSTYWESGMIFPNKILSDLIQIFHPEIKSDTTQKMFYYQKIQ